MLGLAPLCSAPPAAAPAPPPAGGGVSATLALADAVAGTLALEEC